MTIFFIILGILIFIYILFTSDKKEIKNKNLARGGLIKRFPNFVEYCRQAQMGTDTGLEFVKDDGEYLEYKYPLKVLNNKVGYFHLGLQSNFGTFLYVHAVSASGKKIEGYFKEIHNGRDHTKPEDLSVFMYEFIIDELIDKMEQIKDFAIKFTDQ